MAPFRLHTEELTGQTDDQAERQRHFRNIVLDGDGERRVKVRATPSSGESREFEVILRIDTPQEAAYYEHGGILRYVLRQLLKRD